MTKYYKGFEHTNSSDDEEDIITLTSTEEEVKYLIDVVVTHRLSHDTVVYGYIEREKIIDAVRIEASPLNENPYRFTVDLDIPAGETFTLRLKNQSSGNNGGVVGYLVYEIRT